MKFDSRETEAAYFKLYEDFGTFHLCFLPDDLMTMEIVEGTRKLFQELEDDCDLLDSEEQSL